MMRYEHLAQIAGINILLIRNHADSVNVVVSQGKKPKIEDIKNILGLDGDV